MDGCKVCQKTGNLMKCSRCMKVQYCSQDCQRSDWPAHKTVCKRTLLETCAATQSQGPDEPKKKFARVCFNMDKFVEALQKKEIESEDGFSVVVNNLKFSTRASAADDDTQSDPPNYATNLLEPKKIDQNSDKKNPKNRPQYVHGMIIDHTSLTPKYHPVALRPGSHLEEALIYFGIYGHPSKPDSEAFDFILPIPRYDLDIINNFSPAPPENRTMVYKDLFNTITEAATRGRKSGICTVCGGDRSLEFKHTTCSGDPPVIKGKKPFAPFIFDVILPVCSSEDCNNKLVDIRKFCSPMMNEELFNEMKEVYTQLAKVVIDKGLWAREFTDDVLVGYEWRQNAFANIIPAWGVGGGDI